MKSLVDTLGGVNTALFIALALVGIWLWRRRRDSAAGWLASTFLSLGLIVTVGRAVPAHPHGFLPVLGQRIDIELLVLFPYLLYRFATAFRPPARRLQAAVATITSALTVWTFALPHVPASGEKWRWWFAAYVVLFLVHWTLLSVVVALRLWQAGRGRGGVAGSRMRMLAFAAAALTLAIIGLAVSSNSDWWLRAVVQGLGVLAALGFLLGLSPPQAVRMYWRLPAQRELQGAIRELMTLATTREEIARRVLPSIAAIVGAGGVEIRDADGRTVASTGMDGPDGEATETIQLDAPGASLRVRTSPYAPFFGDDELRLLLTLAALVGVALDRVRLFEQERESRLALERANEVMTNFVALAAHELRTPVTAIHGFVQTLNHLGSRLSDEQRREVRTALEQQTARLAGLVEQLLDLSRLDAEAVEVNPQRIDLRGRLEETVAAAASAWDGAVEVAVPDSAEAVVDPAVLDRIVTNLVTNAFRYGRPPVRVAVERANGFLRIAVEDSGPGIAPELEGTLFERFTRSGVARDRVTGTGLGLAIARAYARAHRGDLRYEPGRPSGARFVIELPSI